MSISPTPEPRPNEASPASARPVIGREQLARLFRLMVTLQSGGYPNARELAEQCEVSRRTTYRDLELLAAAGIPVVYRVEQQGYQLARGFFLQPPTLSETEALALLVAARQWQGGHGLGLTESAREGALKVVEALPPSVRDHVLVMAAPFLPLGDPPPRVEPRRAVHDALLESLSRQRQVRLWYRDATSLAGECTRFGIYRILATDHQWYLIGRSSLLRRVDTIGVGWIDRADVTDDRYVIPPRFNLERYLARAWRVRRGALVEDVWLRFSVQAAPRVRDTTWHPSQQSKELSDGRLDLHFEVEGIEEIVPWILGFGEEVEVLAPEALRHRLAQVARHLVERYQASDN